MAGPLTNPRVHAAMLSLRRRDFLILWSGLGVSQIGSQVTQVAVAYQLYQLTHSPLDLGLLGLCRFGPMGLAAFLAGPVADSRDRRRVMLFTQSILFLNSAGMALHSHSRSLTPGLIYAFVALSGLAYAFDGPARQALVPSLVTAEELPNALSLSITVFQLATIIGPALGGVFLRLGGPTLAYGVDAASFAVLLAALTSLRHRDPPPTKPLSVSFESFRDGLRFLGSRPDIFWLMLLDFVATFFAGSMLLLPAFADQILHVGVERLGWLYAAPAVGAVAASVILAGRPPVQRQGQTVLLSVMAYGTAIFLFGLSRNFWLGYLFLAASGAADTLSMVVRNTVRQLRTPNEMRGRMTSVNQLFFVGGPQLGEVEAGIVARLSNVGVSVVSGGVLCIVAAAGLAWLVPLVWRIRADGTGEGT